MGPFSETLCNFCSESSGVELEYTGVAVNSWRIWSLVLSHQITKEVTNSPSDSKPSAYSLMLFNLLLHLFT